MTKKPELALGDVQARSEPFEDEQVWEPAPIPASTFWKDGEWVNINRSPYDRISGVVYKRAMAIKSVQHEPLYPAPELPEMWQGHGKAAVRWLFSEEPGTEERLLPHREFRAFQEVTLEPEASTGQCNHPGRDTILCVVEGRGALSHRASLGSPVIERPLRRGDVVLIVGQEFYSVANCSRAHALRLLVLRLATSDTSGLGERDG